MAHFNRFNLLFRSSKSVIKNQKRWLNLQEYQSKQIMADHSLMVQKFRVVSSVNEAKRELLNGSSPFKCSEYVIKAQVLAGGRGKGHFKNSGMKGGVKLTKDPDEACKITSQMLNDYLITNQTTADGILVQKVMIAEALDISKEYYVAILLDRQLGGLVLVASPSGGMNIEEVAEKTPQDIHKFPLPINPEEMTQKLALDIATKGLGVTNDKIAERAAEQIMKLYQLFVKSDATQIEINPLGVTPDGDVVCFDAKLDFDENAEFRQPWIRPFKDSDPESQDPRMKLAHDYNLNFVPLDNGNIGCLVNGAGLAMATMDIIKLCGGNPANFLDVGGGVTQKAVEKAFELITADPNVKTILVNIFGGIVDCATIARGLVAAKGLLKVPLVVRLEGTNATEAMKILSSVPDIITARDLEEAAKKSVECASR